MRASQYAWIFPWTHAWLTQPRHGLHLRGFKSHTQSATTCIFKYKKKFTSLERGFSKKERPQILSKWGCHFPHTGNFFRYFQHANTFALGDPREKDGACIQMRLSYSPTARLFLFLVQWTDCNQDGARIARIFIRPSTRDPNVPTRTKEGPEEFKKPDGELINKVDAKTQRDAE